MSEPTPAAILMEMQYFPCIQFFSKFYVADKVIIEAHKHYQKGSYRNRCLIAGANGWQRLTIPLRKGKNKNVPIREVQIAYDENWRTQHWRTIQSAYGKAPFFIHYEHLIAPLFQKKELYLFDFNQNVLQTILNILQIENDKIKYSTAYRQQTPESVLDWRDRIRPKDRTGKQDPLFRPQKYVQVFEDKHGFQPNLSILDLIFCTGPEASIILKNSVQTEK